MPQNLVAQAPADHVLALDTAAAVGCSPATVKRNRNVARLWATEEQITGGGEVVCHNIALAHTYIAGTLDRSRLPPGNYSTPSPLAITTSNASTATPPTSRPA